MELLGKKLFFDKESFISKESGIYSVLISNRHFKWLRITLTGKDILYKLDGTKELRQVIKEMAEEYELPEYVIQEDLINFCESCLDQNIILEECADTQVVKYNDELKYLHLDITNACNLDCVYCNKCICKDIDKADFLKPDDLVNYMETLFPNKEASKTVVYISGGEPLLHTGLEELLKIISSYKCKISVITNGILMDENKADFLKEYCDNVIISLDHYEEDQNDSLRGKGSFSGAVKAANICLNNKIPFVIAATPTKQNYEKFDQIFSFVQNLGATAFMMNQPIYYNENDEVIKGFFEYNMELFADRISQIEKKVNIINSWRNSKLSLTKAKSNILFITSVQGCLNNILSVVPKENCSAGINRISIDVYGNIYPCHNLHIRSQKMCMVKEYKEAKSKIVKTDEIEGCDSCEYKIFCLGGCRAEAFYNSKNIKAKNPLCESLKKSYEGLIWTPIRPIKAGDKNESAGC